jgi:uncharacterized protein YjbI with pentapeptide repeats
MRVYRGGRAVGTWIAKRWWIAAIPASVLTIAVVLWGMVELPPRLVDQGIRDPVQREAAAAALRTTLAGILGGFAVLVGTIVGALSLRETRRQNRALLELQRRGQMADRFSRAIEQLGQGGPEKLDVRIGAAYALEQIAQDSAELHWPVMEVLTAYLREHAQVRTASTEAADDAPPERLPADHQAIATVIGRRRRSQGPEAQRLDLHETDLLGVRWAEAHLERADLREADLGRGHLVEAQLEGADLREAHLDGAQLEGADLCGAHLSGAHLEGANLDGAHLKRANLDWAHVERANLDGAHLERANLRGAHLEGANLDGAHLEGAILVDAHLEGAMLYRAHLEGADLDGAHLQGAILVNAHLQGAMLYGAHLERANLLGAHLQGANLGGAQGLTREQLTVAADPPRASLSSEQAAWLSLAAEVSPAVASEPGPERAGGSDPE